MPVEPQSTSHKDYVDRPQHRFPYQLGFTAWVRHHVRRGLLDRPGLVLRAAMLGP